MGSVCLKILILNSSGYGQKKKKLHCTAFCLALLMSYSTPSNCDPQGTPPLPPRTYPSILTKAGIPPDLKIASSPSLWWERLCSVPAVQRAVSTSFVFWMVLTIADTIWGERMMAWREASFFDSWWTITDALLTTTWVGWGDKHKCYREE